MAENKTCSMPIHEPLPKDIMICQYKKQTRYKNASINAYCN